MQPIYFLLRNKLLQESREVSSVGWAAETTPSAPKATETSFACAVYSWCNLCGTALAAVRRGCNWTKLDYVQLLICRLCVSRMLSTLSCVIFCFSSNLNKGTWWSCTCSWLLSCKASKSGTYSIWTSWSEFHCFTSSPLTQHLVHIVFGCLLNHCSWHNVQRRV